MMKFREVSHFTYGKLYRLKAKFRGATGIPVEAEPKFFIAKSHPIDNFFQNPSSSEYKHKSSPTPYTINIAWVWEVSFNCFKLKPHHPFWEDYVWSR